ncbi:NAD-dependent epimerase/dehydratase family protein [Flagellimonas meridianipacifica]|uniref:2'-hydroxyisoflavone reductase n=1 Tax=Flagellimonas meridianipacifica TaxID=1080225 RepID=A0A2T0MH96_9FLAO|nr:NAD-dependent epimerase/dehydratase family protein [Allomuricauda pacifica]PRX56950.1 2'-hydroxyisoflavone reductase [Allomuricauda pacifica]
MNKRSFLKTSALGATAVLANPFEALNAGLVNKSNGKKALMLGGRGFIGPSIVKALLAAGNEVTLLNRGKTNADLFPNLPVIICDRERENKAGLKAIAKKYKETYWDVVVDTWQKSPKAVSDFLEEFKDSIGHYHYISTISVYDKWDKKYIVESEPLNPLPPEPTTIGEEFRYAIRKTFAEEAIRKHTNRYTIYRSSGMKDYRVTDPSDPNDQPYWPVRFNRGGEILVPKIDNHYIQFTDVQSLVHFLVQCSENKTYGEFNVAHATMTFKDYVSCLSYVTQKPDKLHWIDGEFLEKEGLLPYRIVPFWREQPVGFYYFNIQKALSAGLINRPVTDMLADQIAGYKNRFPKDDVRFGTTVGENTLKYFSMEKEKEVIRKWLASK